MECVLYYEVMEPTRIRQSPLVPALLIGGGTVVGVLLGLYGPALARGITDLLDRTPFGAPGLLERLADLDTTWSLPLLSAAGLLGGIFLTIAAASEAPDLTITRDHLEHRLKGLELWIERREVATAFRDRDDLVLLRPDGGLRARISIQDLPHGAVDKALTRDGWPLRDDDPHGADFEPWLDGRPGYDADEHTLLRERRTERKDGTNRRRADEALAAAGLVARDEQDRLLVRRVRGRRPSSDTTDGAAGWVEDGQAHGTDG